MRGPYVLVRLVSDEDRLACGHTEARERVVDHRGIGLAAAEVRGPQSDLEVLEDSVQAQPPGMRIAGDHVVRDEGEPVAGREGTNDLAGMAEGLRRGVLGEGEQQAMPNRRWRVVEHAIQIGLRASGTEGPVRIADAARVVDHERCGIADAEAAQVGEQTLVARGLLVAGELGEQHAAHVEDHRPDRPGCHLRDSPYSEATMAFASARARRRRSSRRETRMPSS